MASTLDAEELSFLRQTFRSRRQITVSQLVDRLEEMDYLLDGDAGDLIRSVVPKAFEANKLTLQDAIKVATTAKSQDSEGGQVPATLGREDSLAELESSFNRQMQSGGIPTTVSEDEPPPPTPTPLGRDDSLAQLESSFEKQVISGDIPEVVHEAEESGGSDANGVGHAPVVRVDLPRRRMPERSDTLSVFARKYPGGTQGPNPEADDVPHRRARSSPHLGRVRRAGGVVRLDEAFGVEDSTLPASPELVKQTSEEALLDTAADTLGVDVEVSNLPMRRKSMAVSKSWSEAVAEDTVIAALESRRLELEKEAEAARARQEAARIREEVTACLAWLAQESKTRFTLSEAKENADRAAAEALAELQRAEASHARAEVETVLRLAMDSLERDAAIAAVEAAMEEAERKAEQEAKALAAEAEARVSKEAKAREEAQRKAEDAERQVEEAIRRADAVESEAKQREDSLRVAVLEAEGKVLEERSAVLKAAEEEKEAHARMEVETVLRLAMDSLERDAAIAAVEAAREEADKKAEQEAKALAAEAEARVSREAAAREEAQRKAEDAERQVEEAIRRADAVESEAKQREDSLRAAVLEAEGKVLEERVAVLKAAEDEKDEVERAKQEAIREAVVWKEKYEEAQQRLAAAAAEKEAHKSAEKPRKLVSVEQRHHFDSDGSDTNVSYEAVGPTGWWQCLVCSPNVEPTIEDYSTGVGKMKSESRISSSDRAASMRSTRSEGRPSDGDVCSVM